MTRRRARASASRCCSLGPLALELAADFFDALFFLGLSDVYADASDDSVLLSVLRDLIFYNMRLLLQMPKLIT